MEEQSVYELLGRKEAQRETELNDWNMRWQMALGTLRALKNGTIKPDDIEMIDNGYQIVPKKKDEPTTEPASQ
jgi:hypothetical protein